MNELAKKIKAAKIRFNSWIKCAYLRSLGVKVGRNVTFGGKLNLRFNGDPRRIEIQDNVTFLGDVDLRNRENGAIIIERSCYFDHGLRLVAAREATIQIGADTQAGLYLIINAGANVTLGKKCLISSFVNINGSTHPTFRDEPVIDQGYVQGSAEIGDDVWLGSCVCVNLNSRIGKGVVAGANSVVGGNVPPYSIVLGSPAKIVGSRQYRARPIGTQSSGIAPESTLLKVREAYKAVAREAELPADQTSIRGNALLSSLDWITFITELEARFDREIPTDVSISSSFDSIQSIAAWLSTGTSSEEDAASLRIPTGPYHLAQRLLELTKAHPTKTILSVKAEGQEFVDLDYRGLLSLAGRFGAELRKCGVKPGQRVGIIYPTSVELVGAFWGCILTGTVPSVFSYPSSKVPADVYSKSHSEMFRRMGLSAICCGEDLKSHLEPLLDRSIQMLSDLKASAEDSMFEEISPRNFDMDETALIQHSSGTTGVQKGVALSHRAISQQLNVYSRELKINENDRIISWLPLYHDMGLVACFLLPVLSGVPLALFSPFEWIANPAMFFSVYERYSGTLAWLPNFAFSVLTKSTPLAKAQKLDLSAAKAFVSCSEPVLADTMGEFLDRFKVSGVTADRLWSCYAMAENTFAVSQASFLKTVEANGRKFVSQGKPLPNVSVKILNADLQELPVGVVGEICLKSDCMLNGYYNNPDATTAAFADGWYKTGDLGFVLDGEVYISGRKKDLIIIGGRNFYPQDIEHLVGKVDGVKPGRCAAFGVFNSSQGTEDLIVVAERSENSARKTKEIEMDVRRLVSDELDCVINSFVLVEPGTILKTSSGKVSRSACKERYASAELAKV